MIKPKTAWFISINQWYIKGCENRTGELWQPKKLAADDKVMAKLGRKPMTKKQAIAECERLNNEA